MGVLDRCESCGSEMEPNARFCIKCGAILNVPRKCNKCDAPNASEATFCAGCGERLDGTKHSESESAISEIWSTQREPDKRVEGNICPQCGTQSLSTDWMCSNCGLSFYEQPRENRSLRDTSSMPVIVGVLLLIASFLNIGNGLLVGSVGAFIPAYGFCGAAEVVIGIATIPGAIAAMNRRHFVPVGIVSVLTLFSVGPCFICSILGLIAIIGLFVSHDEFDRD